MKTRGFSLVELSIVLVILGLLVGGILAGQSLIRASELRSVSADLDKYKTAVYAFKDKYFALPGDMQGATKFWGPADGNDGIDYDCIYITTPATNATTCNGSGEGGIGVDNNFSAGWGSAYERHRAWQHLSNAGLVAGSYSGVIVSVDANGTRTSRIGLDVPRSRIDTAGFELYWTTSGQAGDANSNRIIFGSNFTVAGIPLEIGGPALTTKEAWNIDTKMDDGFPQSGKVKATRNNFFYFSCSPPANNAYWLTATGAQCPLFYDLGL